MPKISEEQIVNSALWAAYGDAVGFPTELISRDDFIKRNKIHAIEGPIDWTRRVGGLFGPEIPFPVGTYSDDTQLRLSTSRAIRGDGYFDVESFAKVELPVWLNYALGAGRGSKAAAANLSLREATWSQNFYSSNNSAYWNGGGNGAAMRIQPHVWQSHVTGPVHFMPDVIKNSICTHGHPRAIIGAAIHALFVYETLIRREMVNPMEWSALGESAAVQAYEALVDDPELSLVWIPNWENLSKKSLNAVWAETVMEWHQAVDVALKHCVDGAEPVASYHALLHELHGFKAEERGSGLKTVLFASALAWLFRHDSPEVGLLVSANTFRSDTDTIATMAGAISGAVAELMPHCEIQDSAYIQDEARRIYRIGAGKKQPSFRYPDLLSWIPPKNQSDAWQVRKGHPYLAGIGELFMLGEPFASTKGTELLWQWCSLPFGQTVLTKRRKLSAHYENAPDTPHQVLNNEETRKRIGASVLQQELALSRSSELILREAAVIQDSSQDKRESIDDHTNLCIKSGFDATIIGQSFLALACGDLGIEKAIAFSAIVAKAKIAREKKS